MKRSIAGADFFFETAKKSIEAMNDSERLFAVNRLDGLIRLTQRIGADTFGFGGVKALGVAPNQKANEFQFFARTVAVKKVLKGDIFSTQAKHAFGDQIHLIPKTFVVKQPSIVKEMMAI